MPSNNNKRFNNKKSTYSRNNNNNNNNNKKRKSYKKNDKMVHSLKTILYAMGTGFILFGLLSKKLINIVVDTDTISKMLPKDDNASTLELRLTNYINKEIKTQYIEPLFEEENSFIIDKINGIEGLTPNQKNSINQNLEAELPNIIDTFKKSAAIAADHGERLAVEGEICWAGMHSWKDVLDLLEGVGMPETLGFQADLAHTYLYLMGYNAPEHALLHDGYSEDEFYAAYEKMTDKLRPWTIDFHVAQNDGQVHGAGSHDKTGKHCPADDPNGKLDITRCSSYWLKDFQDRGMKHICWDGCMFSNATLETPNTWNTILKAMVDVVSA